MTPAELSREVRAVFAYAARYLSQLAESDPHGSAANLLTRPDVEAVLHEALDRGRELAQDAVREAWGGGPRHEYLDWLLTDVDRSYDSLAVLRAAVRVSWLSSPTHAGRAEAVKNAVLAHGTDLALRNRLAAEVAAPAARAQAEIAQGEELQSAGVRVWKQWRCRCTGNIPDERVCHWCRALHGMVIPLHANFPMGEPHDLTGHGRLTRPPRLYHGVLAGPPRHPRCRCHIKILTDLEQAGVASGAGGQEAAPATSPVVRQATPGFLTAADIRAVPESRYQALVHFVEAAVHELGQVLGRLRRARDGGSG